MEVDHYTQAAFDTNIMPPTFVYSELYSMREAALRFEAYAMSPVSKPSFVSVEQMTNWLKDLWNFACVDTYNFSDADKYMVYYVPERCEVDFAIEKVSVRPCEDVARTPLGVAVYRCCCDSCSSFYFATYMRVPHKPCDGTSRFSFASRRRINVDSRVFPARFSILAKVQLANQSGRFYVSCIRPSQLTCPMTWSDELEDCESAQ